MTEEAMAADSGDGGEATDTITGGGDEAPQAEPAKEPAKEFDWRREMAGDDEKLYKQLERLSDLKSVGKSYGERGKRIAEGFKPPELPENATEEQVAEYRRLIGVPESPDAYQFNLPEGVVIGDADKPLWDLFLKEANALNMTQAEFDKVAPAYYKLEAAIAEQADADMKEKMRQYEADLKSDWGSDYSGNMNVNENFLVKSGGEDLKAALGEAMYNPLVAKFINEQARISGFADTMAYGTADAQAGIDNELASLQKMMGDYNSDYWKGPQAEKHQKRFRELSELKSRVKS